MAVERAFESAIPGGVGASEIDRAIQHARDALLTQQRADGHWSFELEADCTIPAEYILMMHFLAEFDAPLQAKLAVHLRGRQAEHGGWPLYHGGAFDISLQREGLLRAQTGGR